MLLVRQHRPCVVGARTQAGRGASTYSHNEQLLQPAILLLQLVDLGVRLGQLLRR